MEYTVETRRLSKDRWFRFNNVIIDTYEINNAWVREVHPGWAIHVICKNREVITISFDDETDARAAFQRLWDYIQQ